MFSYLYEYEILPLPEKYNKAFHKSLYENIYRWKAIELLVLKGPTLT